eukprot:scaffold1237_cov403-Prasinococcus_capsulatus_cf.AAC.18
MMRHHTAARPALERATRYLANAADTRSPGLSPSAWWAGSFKRNHGVFLGATIVGRVSGKQAPAWALGLTQPVPLPGQLVGCLAVGCGVSGYPYMRMTR